MRRMDLNHRSEAYETSGDDRTPPLRCVYLSSITPYDLLVNTFWQKNFEIYIVMNQYAVPLDLELPLFNSPLDPVSFIKSKPRWSENVNSNTILARHFRLDRYNDVSAELNKFFDLHNQKIVLCEIFYTPPAEGLFIHIDDTILGDIAKINWIFGGEGSEMHWYSPITTGTVGSTRSETPYILYNKDEVQLEHSQSLTGPNLLQVGCPHNITNGDQERFCLSVVFFDKTLNRRPTMAEARETFKDYLK